MSPAGSSNSKCARAHPPRAAEAMRGTRPVLARLQNLLVMKGTPAARPAELRMRPRQGRRGVREHGQVLLPHAALRFREAPLEMSFHVGRAVHYRMVNSHTT